MAQETDVFQLVAGGSVTADSNFFRLPDSVDAQSIGRAERSETIRSGYVGIRVDKPYSLQRFQLDVRRTAYRHETYPEYDFDASSYRGAWLWHLTSRLSGVLSADGSETAVPFSDFEGTRQNVRKIEDRSFSLDGVLSPGWHVVLGLGTNRQKSSVPVVAQADFESERAEVGFRHALRSGSFFAITQRIVEGEYLDRDQVSPSILDEDFRERQTEVQASWIISAKSTVTGRLTRMARKHPNLRERDFHARGGSASYAWIPTGKLQVTLNVQRDISASLDVEAPYVRQDIVAVTPVWQATAKIALRPRLAVVRTEYVAVNASNPSREDETEIAEMTVTWTASRNIALSAGLGRERRSSNRPEFGYRTKTARLDASFVF